MAIAEQFIPPEEVVSRLIDFPRTYEPYKGFIWPEVFAFQRGDPESVVWRRFARTDDDVHEIGWARATAKKAKRPDFEHVGFISAEAGNIRGIVVGPGHGFDVLHVPEDGQDHHSEIRYRLLPDSPLRPSEKADLKFSLCKRFSDLVEAPKTK